MIDGRISGKVYFIGETEVFQPSGFKKRLLVLEEGDEYKNHIPFEFTQRRCSDADALNLNDEVEIEFRLGGRKWQKDPQSEVKYFLSAKVFGCRVLKRAEPVSTGSATSGPQNDMGVTEAPNDEIPF